MMTDHRSDNLRYELKLTCSPHLLPQVRMWIKLNPAGFRPAHPTRLVNNLYFDTPGLNSFNANQAGVSSRQKLRLRWYGEVANDTTSDPILELKIKENLLGDKKRLRLNCTIDWRRSYTEILQMISGAASSEWHQWLNSATQPTLINRYQRDYFETLDGQLRATLDYNQVAYEQRLTSRPNLSRPSPMENLTVIEIKGSPKESERIEAIMAEFPLPRSRNSKYVNGLSAARL